MAKQDIGIGASANDGTGDELRTAGQKINANFTELYGAVDGLENELAGKQPADPKLSAIVAAAPIADGTYTIGTNTITTVGGIITAIT